MRRTAWGVILAATLLLAALWRLLPASPPLYDGLCTADPYRLLGHSPAPSSATMTYPGAQFPAAEVTTPNESPAQAQILMMSGTFSSAAPVTIAIEPVSPPAGPPSGLRLDSNTYRFTAVAGGRTVQPTQPVTVILRGSGDTSTLTMYVDAGAGWEQLRTFNVGCGLTFEAVSTKLGHFALFTPAGGSGGGGGSGGFPVGIVVGVLAAVVVVVTIALARLSVTRRR